jgi:hypothetical protein
VALRQVDFLDRTDAQDGVAEPRPSVAGRLREIRAVFFVGVGLLATVAWIAILGWLLYRAVPALGFQ